MKELCIKGWMMGDSHSTKEELYQVVKDLITRNDFDKKIEEEIRNHGHLLDEDTAALLITDKMGRNIHQVKKIQDFTINLRVILFVKIMGIYEEKKLDNGKMIKFRIGDETGNCLLTLWNTEADRIKEALAENRTTIKIVNGYTKDGFYGLEVNIGKWGFLEIEPNDAPPLHPIEGYTMLADLSHGIVDIQGKIVTIEKTHPFIKENGDTGFVTTILIQDDTGMKHLIVWGERVKDMQKFREGDMIAIMGAYIKNGEIHVDMHSKISKI